MIVRGLENDLLFSNHRADPIVRRNVGRPEQRVAHHWWAKVKDRGEFG